MALAEITSVQRTRADAPCPGCRQLQRQVVELEAELARHRRGSRLPAQAILLVGTLVLATLPPVCLGGFMAAAEYLPLGLVTTCYGMVVAMLLAPWAVFGICGMLSWRPLWQRGLIFPPAFTATGVSMLLFSWISDPDGIGLPNLAVFPMLVLITLLPCLPCASGDGGLWRLAIGSCSRGPHRSPRCWWQQACAPPLRLACEGSIRVK